MRVTIKDIARIAEVSRTTVSNVLNGVYKCTPETKAKILKISKELDYKPNIAAKTLVKNTSNLIGLVLPSYVDKRLLTGSPFYNLIIDGVNATLREKANYDLIINCITTDQNPNEVKDWARMRNLDGLIVVGEFDEKNLEELDKEKLPMVLIDNYFFQLKNSSFINTEDEKGGYIATKHLVEKGYKKIAICSSSIEESSVNKRRYKGYQKCILENKLEECIFEVGGMYFEDGLKIADDIIKKDIDALFVTGDILALGILKKLIGLKKSVPKEIGIIGFDDLEMSKNFIPSLTTIDQNIFEKGETAVEVLLKMIEHKIENESILMPVNLIKRETT